jgi:Tfp pilus assembly protein PilF
LALRPQHVDALEGRGGALIELGRHEEALRTLNQALALSPKNKVALARRGNALFELGRYAESLASYDAALAIDPHFPGAHNNRGYALLALSRLDEALASYQAALEHKPQSLEALNNIGNVLAALDHYDEAERFYDRAAALAPDRAEAKWNKGLLYLSLGRLAEGWELFEQRFHGGVKDLPLRAYPQPRWSGGKVAGELLVWGEQGLGDQIIYASMIPDLFPLADSVVLELDPRLVPLFARSFPQARVVPLCAQPYPGPIVAHTPVGSLGRLLRPTFDAFPRRENGYLVADPVRVAALRQRLASDGSKVIGLSWRSVARLIGTAKTAQLADFEALLRLPGCRFVDLQYGDTCADCASVERELGIRIERLGDIDNTNDIDGLAALITACDAVATVSNTTAHLAGALGRPTWIFAPFGNARIWYWFRQRSDSPWYPHVRLCRQQQGESWVNLITSAVPQLSTSLAKV